LPRGSDGSDVLAHRAVAELVAVNVRGGVRTASRCLPLTSYTMPVAVFVSDKIGMLLSDQWATKKARIVGCDEILGLEWLLCGCTFG
jgi:hypothetical protein